MKNYKSLLMIKSRTLSHVAIALCFGASVAIPAFAQKTYSSPEAAAAAFQAAVADADHKAMSVVLGEKWKTFIPTQDVEKEDIDVFLAAWGKGHRVVTQTPGKSLVEVGDQGWTLPIPIVKTAKGWKFDPVKGVDEMKTRRIGRNELATIQATLAYFDAQKEYASMDHNGDGVLEYAQKFKSSPGKQDGLYWPMAPNVAESPLGPLVADLKPGDGYHGYRYKILTSQGKAAPGGAYSYLIKGRMVSGFAVVAWPLRYGDTGVMSFLISHDGKIYEKNLGPKTADVVAGMTKFNPDESWAEVLAPASMPTPTEKLVTY